METTGILKAVGIPMIVITIIFLIAAIFVAYRNFLETVKLKLEIKQLQTAV